MKKCIFLTFTLLAALALGGVQQHGHADGPGYGRQLAAGYRADRDPSTG